MGPSTDNELRSVPLPDLPHSLDLLLQLEETIHESLGGGRAAWHVNVDWHDAVAASHHSIGVVVVAASVGAAAHGQDPLGIRHLIVDLSKRRSHFVSQGPGHNDAVSLAGRGPEDDAVAIHVVTRGGNVHHLDGAASKAKGHGPKAVLAAPIQKVVQSGQCPFTLVALKIDLVR